MLVTFYEFFTYDGDAAKTELRRTKQSRSQGFFPGLGAGGPGNEVED